MQAIFPKILQIMRFIHSTSKYYNTRDRMCSLLRKVSNVIIGRCCAHISLNEIFHGDVNASVLKLNECIQAGKTWKELYQKTVAHCDKFGKGHKWEFDESGIFAQIDAFVQRCHDLIEGNFCTYHVFTDLLMV